MELQIAVYTTNTVPITTHCHCEVLNGLAITRWEEAGYITVTAKTTIYGRIVSYKDYCKFPENVLQ